MKKPKGQQYANKLKRIATQTLKKKRKRGGGGGYSDGPVQVNNT